MQNRTLGAMLGFAVGDAVGSQLSGAASPGEAPVVAEGTLRVGPDTRQLVLAAVAITEGGAAPDSIAIRFAAHIQQWYHQPGVAARHPAPATMRAAARLLAGERWDRVSDPESEDAEVVVRAVPVGLVFAPDRVAGPARALAGVTHGHPTGLLVAHVVAWLVSASCRGHRLDASLVESAAGVAGDNPVGARLAQVAEVARSAGPMTPATPGPAEEADGRRPLDALELALRVALEWAPASDWRAFEIAVERAARIRAGGDTVGALVGALLGTAWGAGAVPRHLLELLEGRDELIDLARGLWLRSSERELDTTPYEADRVGGYTGRTPTPTPPRQYNLPEETAAVHHVQPDWRPDGAFDGSGQSSEPPEGGGPPMAIGPDWSKRDT